MCRYIAVLVERTAGRRSVFGHISSLPINTSSSARDTLPCQYCLCWYCPEFPPIPKTHGRSKVDANKVIDRPYSCYVRWSKTQWMVVIILFLLDPWKVISDWSPSEIDETRDAYPARAAPPPSLDLPSLTHVVFCADWRLVTALLSCQLFRKYGWMECSTSMGLDASRCVPKNTVKPFSSVASLVPGQWIMALPRGLRDSNFQVVL